LRRGSSTVWEAAQGERRRSWRAFVLRNHASRHETFGRSAIRTELALRLMDRCLVAKGLPITNVPAEKQGCRHLRKPQRSADRRFVGSPHFSGVAVLPFRISTLYYPASSRTELRLVHNVLFDIGVRAAGNLLQEFVFCKVTTHAPRTAAPSQPIPRRNTDIADFGRQLEFEDGGKRGTNGSIAFVLANDIQVGGAIVAQASSRAWGQVSYASRARWR
jgi:hypothetical protein